MHSASDRTDDTDPRPGDVIAEKFIVEEVLGSGAMGVVVAARSIALDRAVAVKLVKRASEITFARFEREARALAALESDHVVRVLEFGTTNDGTPYLVMERLVGRDLAGELRARGPLPVGEAVDHVLEACEGLSEAHARGVVHRDIKPANLFLAQREGDAPRLKILDFGISKVAKQAEDEESLTKTSATLGSPAYMSPEQLRLSKSVDQRTDIWSLGVVLHRLLTGHHPFVADGFSALCAAVIADEPPPIRRDRPDVPAGVEAVVLRCLAKDVAARYASVADLSLALAPFASDRGQRAAVKVAARSRLKAPELLAAPAVPGTTTDTGLTGTLTGPSLEKSSLRRVLPLVAVVSFGGFAAVVALRLFASPSPREAARAEAPSKTMTADTATTSADWGTPIPPASSVVTVASSEPSAAASIAAPATTGRVARGTPIPVSSPPRSTPPAATSAPFGGAALRSRN